MTPAASVVMAVHNGEPYLATAIHSILTQSFEDFEFIIVDDGSTDATPAILAEHARLDSRVQVISPERHLGFTPALNVALSSSRSPFIVRQDADDLSHPSRLETQFRAFSENDHLGLVGSSYDVIDVDGNHLKTETLETSDTTLRWLGLFHNPFCHSAVMVRRDLIDRVGGYNEALAFSQDFDLWARIMPYTRVANLEAPLVSWRTHPHAISTRRRVQQQRISDEISARQMAALLKVEKVTLSEVEVLRRLVHGHDDGIIEEHKAAALSLLRRLFSAFEKTLDITDCERSRLVGLGLIFPSTRETLMERVWRKASNHLPLGRKGRFID
ncbi:glycosyltransferase family 2 protein [Rhodospira trueperi]|uniref:Glycosyl transferase family 2 n=1 Tax=Rhodospira trueperi TaxID=69960 RepID=A0A1G7GQW2_9PROT|nr:glycosyltransferase [Rhodospira trueperi]SDE90522.1 Glycosyl transferase family 2 [Rhodospira trueperi]